MYKNWLLSLVLLFGFYISYGQTNSRNLDYYLQTATTNSPLLKDYQNRIRTGGIDSLLINASDKPHISANGQVALYPTLNGYGYDPAVTNGANYNAVLSVSQPLFNKKRLQPQYRQVKINNLRLSNQKKISQLTLHKKITQQYLIAYANQLQLQSSQKIEQLLRQQKDLLKKLVKNGVYKESDYLTFLTTLQTQEIATSQLQLKYKTSLYRLNYLCGITDTTTVSLAQPSLEIALSNTQDSSLFFKQYRIDSLKIQNKKALLDAQYKPQISWFANVGLMTSTLHNIHHYFGAGFGLNISIPIYDGKQRKLKTQQFKIAEQTRANYADFYHQQYNQKLEMLKQQLKGINNLIDKIREKLQSAQLLIKVDKKLLNTGNLKIPAYLLALQNYLTISNNLNLTKIKRYQIINKLNYWNH